MLHSLSIINLEWLNKDHDESATSSPVKITFKSLPDIDPDEDLPSKQVLEVKQKKTAPPKESAFVGVEDHATKKQTRIAEEVPRVKAADAGVLGEGKDSSMQGENAPMAEPKRQLDQLFSKIKSHNAKKVRPLDRLTPSMGGGSPTAGYFDYITDVSIELGDVIDINTTKSMFIGYFASIRKSIELVWIYPKEAVQRNMQGAVKLQFDIQRSGEANNILVKGSSGYEILDKHVVEAIRLAQPFPPLPAAYEKDKLVVLATYHYVLQHNVAH